MVTFNVFLLNYLLRCMIREGVKVLGETKEYKRRGEKGKKEMGKMRRENKEREKGTKEEKPKEG